MAAKHNPPLEALHAAVARGVQEHGAIVEQPVIDAAVRCPICHAVNDHTLSCPTRWYR